MEIKFKTRSSLSMSGYCHNFHDSTFRRQNLINPILTRFNKMTGISPSWQIFTKLLHHVKNILLDDVITFVTTSLFFFGPLTDLPQGRNFEQGRD